MASGIFGEPVGIRTHNSLIKSKEAPPGVSSCLPQPLNFVQLDAPHVAAAVIADSAVPGSARRERTALVGYPGPCRVADCRDAIPAPSARNIARYRSAR